MHGHFDARAHWMICVQQTYMPTVYDPAFAGTLCTGRFSSKASSNKVNAVHQVDAASLAKAHKLSVPVGVLAGVFGSFVGVGGGVLIVPLLTGACKALPQRYAGITIADCVSLQLSPAR